MLHKKASATWTSPRPRWKQQRSRRQYRASRAPSHTLSKYQVAAMRPYGMWTVADGRQVLFNRCYRPILERYPGASAKAVIEFEWVAWREQIWFFTEATPEPLRVTTTNAVLAAWGLPPLPKRPAAPPCDGNPWVELLFQNSNLT